MRRVKREGKKSKRKTREKGVYELPFNGIAGPTSGRYLEMLIGVKGRKS